MLTSYDLWPPWKTITIINSLRSTNILSLKFKNHSLLEISCLQGFETLTYVDVIWPLTYMENNRDHLLTKGYLHAKFEVEATFPSSDIMFTKFWYIDLWWPQMTFELHEKTIGIIYSLRGTYTLSLKFKQLLLLEILCLQGFETLISVYLKWPLTSMKNNRDHLLTKGYLYTTFEVRATFNSWDIVFTTFWYFDLCWPPWKQ